MEKTIGEQLNALREEAQVSLQAIAQASGYAAPSSIQRFFEPTYDPGILGNKVALKLAKGFTSLGLNGERVLALANIRPLREPSIYSPKDNNYDAEPAIVVCGTKLNRSTRYPEAVPADVETFTIDRNLRYVARPEHLRGRGIEGIYLPSASMAPRYEQGEVVFYEIQQSPRVGDDVIVFIAEGGDDKVLECVIGRLVATTPVSVKIEQFNPFRQFELFPLTIDLSRILRPQELLAPFTDWDAFTR